MKKTYTINVTARDLKRGVKGSCGLCPIALAVKRHFPGLLVSTGFLLVKISNASMQEQRRAIMPELASQFVYDFDSFSSVKPFSFKLTFE